METGSVCGGKPERLSLSRPYPYIKTLLIIFLFFQFSFSSYPLYSEQIVQAVVKSSSDLIEHYGKDEIISKIMYLRRSRISIEVKGTLRNYWGLPDPAYISPRSILLDIQKLGMSLEQFATILHKDKLARTQSERAEPKRRSKIVSGSEITGVSLDKLMALSGLKKQVAELPGLVRAGVEEARQKGSAIPDVEFRDVQKSIEGAFQPSEILTAIGI